METTLPATFLFLSQRHVFWLILFFFPHAINTSRIAPSSNPNCYSTVHNKKSDIKLSKWPPLRSPSESPESMPALPPATAGPMQIAGEAPPPTGGPRCSAGPPNRTTLSPTAKHRVRSQPSWKLLRRRRTRSGLDHASPVASRRRRRSSSGWWPQSPFTIGCITPRSLLD